MTLRLNHDLLRSAICAALVSSDERSFYCALRVSVKELIIQQFAEGTLLLTSAESLHGVKRISKLVNGSTKDVTFASGYGFGAYSVTALNYLDGDLVRFDSLLPFIKCPSFSIGNLLFEVTRPLEQLDVDCDGSFSIAGYDLVSSPKGKKQHLCLYNVQTCAAAVKTVMSPDSKELHLDPLAPCECPPTWIDRYSGRVFTCTCFSAFAKSYHLPHNSHFPTIEPSMLPHLEVHEGLCSICSDHIPPPNAGHPMYYNSFLVRYLPYRALFFHELYGGQELAAEKWEEAERAAENAAREAVGYPRIGEQWPSETLLFRITCQVLGGQQVIHHHKPDFLEGLEFDIYVPSLKLAIECQGVQHYKPVERFGGEQGFHRLRERDARKRMLALQCGIHLHEWHFETPITEEAVRDITEKRRRSFLGS